MNLFKQLFNSPRAAAMHSQLHPQASQPPVASQAGIRRELVRVTLRDTLIRHGIPTAWVGSEMLLASGGGKEPGIHLRLLLKHWDARLLTHGVAFEKTFLKRLSLMDPLAPAWINGISWQFALADETGCPAMPDPAIWNVRPSARTVPPPLIKTAAASTSPQAQATALNSAPAAGTRSDLDRVFADNDARQPIAAGAMPEPFQMSPAMFKPTEPASL